VAWWSIPAALIVAGVLLLVTADLTEGAAWAIFFGRSSAVMAPDVRGATDPALPGRHAVRRLVSASMAQPGLRARGPYGLGVRRAARERRVDAAAGDLPARSAAGVPSRVADPQLITPPAGMTQSEWLHMVMVSLLLRGNAYGLIAARDAWHAPPRSSS
jgi:hypothetical protein